MVNAGLGEKIIELLKALIEKDEIIDPMDLLAVLYGEQIAGSLEEKSQDDEAMVVDVEADGESLNNMRSDAKRALLDAGVEDGEKLEYLLNVFEEMDLYYVSLARFAIDIKEEGLDRSILDLDVLLTIIGKAKDHYKYPLDALLQLARAGIVNEENMENISALIGTLTNTYRATVGMASCFHSLRILAVQAMEKGLVGTILDPDLLLTIANNTKSRAALSFNRISSLVQSYSPEEKNEYLVDPELIKKIAVIAQENATDIYLSINVMPEVIEFEGVSSKIAYIDLLMAVADQLDNPNAITYEDLIKLGRQFKKGKLNDKLLDPELLIAVINNAGDRIKEAFKAIYEIAEKEK